MQEEINNEEPEIDYFGFKAFELAEDLKEIMPSLTAKYSKLARQARENEEHELDCFYSKKAKETHKIFGELKINRDKEFVKAELEKFKIELKQLRANGE